MKVEDNDNQQTPKDRNARLSGKRLGTRGIVAQAMLEQGASLRTVRKVTGISTTTGTFLRKNKVIPREQVERVKRHLQDKFAMIASQALESIDEDKLKQAGFGELVRGAALAAERAGIGNVSVHEHYQAVMMKYDTIPDPIVPDEGAKTIEPPATKTREGL